MRMVLLALVAAFAVGAALVAGPAPRASAEPPTEAEQIQDVIRNFAIANEWHYSETMEYTDDIEVLQERYQWPNVDSVHLAVWMHPENQGYQVVGTHVRVGLHLGCAFHVGAVAPVPSPGGRFGEPRRFACDDFGDVE